MISKENTIVPFTCCLNERINWKDTLHNFSKKELMRTNLCKKLHKNIVNK